MTITVDCHHDNWNDKADWSEIAERAVMAGVSVSQYAPMLRADYLASVSVKLSDNDEVQDLNKRFRSKDKPTNVLSFPMVQEDLLQTASNSDDGEILLGDIIVAEGVAREEAIEKDVSLTDYVSHLIVHGTLHLLGYDHERNDAEAEQMEALEAKALASLGLPNPY